MLGKSLLLAVGLVACVSAQDYKERYAQRCTRQGIHPMSRGACESAYIQCVAVGLDAIVFECASSDTRYDVISESCLMPEFVEACGGRSTTTTPAPQQNPTVAPFEFDCSDKRDIDFPNPNKPCSTLYVSCSGGQRFFRECAESNTKFDIVSRRCLEDRFVKTCHGTATTVAPVEETTQAEPDTRCIGKSDGVYAAEFNACSPVILTCFSERAEELLCPEGLRFDKISEECREPEWVRACGGQATTTGRPTTAAPQANPTPFAQIAFCRGKADGNYPFPNACSGQFISCSASHPSLYQCPAELRFSEEADACLKERDVAGCQQADDVQAPSNVCGNKVDGFYPHPTNCRKFFYCDNQSPLELDCAGDLVFDSKHMKCDNKDKILKSACRCGKIPDADVPEFDCAGLSVGFYTNVHDCSSYYLCEENGSAWSFQCQAGFAFDKSLEECKPAAQVGECMPPRVPDMSPFCKGQSRNGVFEHPNECPSGLICLQDVAFELNCRREKPAFDRYLLQCVHTLSAEGKCAA